LPLTRLPLLSVPYFVRLLRSPPIPPLFPYTTLFRSHHFQRHGLREVAVAQGREVVAAVGRPAPDGLEEQARRRVHVGGRAGGARSEEHTSELQSRENLVCRLLLEKKKKSLYKEQSP